jgi:hypothetical protein
MTRNSTALGLEQACIGTPQHKARCISRPFSRHLASNDQVSREAPPDSVKVETATLPEASSFVDR